MLPLNTIICGNVLEVLPYFKSNSIDLIFTSPPYNFSRDYTEYNDSVALDSYTAFLHNVFGECVRVLKSGGRIAINVQPLFNQNFPTHHVLTTFLREIGLVWKCEIIWEKNHYNCRTTAWGSWKSPSNPYLKYTWEFIEVLCKDSLKHSGDQSDADITADEFKKWVYAKWSIKPEHRMKEFEHPAVFPEELVERVIKLFSFRGDTILDPFNGTGTTTYVANKLDRNFIGIDISEQYCATAIKRLEGKYE